MQTNVARLATNLKVIPSVSQRPTCCWFVAIFGPGKKEELDDERIQQLATDGAAQRQDLISIISRCGIPESRLKDVDHGQLHDIIVGLAGFKKECFQKLFSQFLGRTGGTVDAVCRCMVLYMSKTIPFAESPKDAVALLFMFKHLPICAFFDYWCGAVKELQVQAKAVGDIDFGPRNGGLLLEKDMEQAQKSGRIPVSIPAIGHLSPSFSLKDAAQKDAKEAMSVADIAIKRPPHPCAPDCPVCFLAHDRLHEVAHKNCSCRDPCWVKELRAENTERAEHLNATRKRVDPFLRNESPQRNIFLHLVFAHLQNYKINKAKFEDRKAEHAASSRQQPQFHWTLAVNSFGQVVLNKQPISQDR
jgi:hypothetical protein